MSTPGRPKGDHQSAQREAGPVSARSTPGAERPVTLDVSLLGREYKFACQESERAELLEAVAYLDRRMREIRETRKVAGPERIAVMAALNIAHELQRAKRDHAIALEAIEALPAAPREDIEYSFDEAQARRRIGDMHATIDAVLAGADRIS
jgi:cell division protein ZapA